MPNVFCLSQMMNKLNTRVKNKTKNKISFLLGSGTSIPAKLPSTYSITEKIFSGEGIVRGTAEDYFFDDPKRYDYDPYQQFIPRIIAFLGILRDELGEYFKDPMELVNYEDIFYILDFIRKNIYGTEKNPAFKYLLRNFEPRINKLLAPLDPVLESNISFERLLGEALRYIEYSVILSLSKKPKNFSGLDFLGNAISDGSFSIVDIFTLNHDIVVEKFLNLKNEQFCEGFGRDTHVLLFLGPFVIRSSK